MKHNFRRRFVSALLGLFLVLSLTACGGSSAWQGGGSGAPSGSTGALPGEKEEISGNEPATVDDERTEEDIAPLENTERTEEAIVLLRSCIEDMESADCAAAYLEHWEKGDDSSLSDWLRTNCAGLTDKMPFLLAIPAERVLGGSDGNLFCIVPRDDSSIFAVNCVKWESNDAGVWPQNEEVLYRSEYAEPILVFSRYEEFRDEPDIEINVMAENRASVTWYPQLDDWGNIVLPTDWDGYAAMMDFTVFGYTTGLDYPEGDDGWLPPTEEGLADTIWNCDSWRMELLRGSGDPDYFGVAELYHQFEDGQEYQCFYTGVWRMADDCLELMVSAGVGTSTGGCFPVLIDLSGERLIIRQSREGIFPPDDVTSMELTLSYG